MELLQIEPTVGNFIRGVRFAAYLGEKSYDVTKFVTGGDGVRELAEGRVRKGTTGSGSYIVGSNKRVVGSAKNFAKNNPTDMPRKRSGQLTPPRTPKKIRIKPTAVKKKFVRSGKKTAWQVSKKGGKRVGSKRKQPYKIVGESLGSNGGSFKQPVGNMKSFLLTCAKNGYTTQIEKYGSVTDPNSVYVYHSTYDVNNIARTICGAMLRSLFKRSGIEILNESTELPLKDAVNSLDYQIRYHEVNPVDGTSRSWDYTIPDNTSFKYLLDTMSTYTGGTPFKRMVDYMMNVANEFYVPDAIYLLVRDKYYELNAQQYDWRTKTRINLSDEVIVMQCKSVLTLQNRTKGSTAGATDLSVDRIDNQPLKGKLYEFSNGDPRIREAQKLGTGILNMEDNYLNTGAMQAARAFGGTDIANGYMREPPQAKFWKNCISSANVNLEPGVMKKTEIVVSYKTKIPELFKKFRIDVAGNNEGLFSAYHNLRSHKSQFLGLEEVLRTPADNPITCQYEVENTVGAYLYSKKTKGVFRMAQTEENIGQIFPST
jgi:hypothetical protein